jgi:hypothetical protein
LRSIDIMFVSVQILSVDPRHIPTSLRTKFTPPGHARHAGQKIKRHSVRRLQHANSPKPTDHLSDNMITKFTVPNCSNNGCTNVSTYRSHNAGIFHNAHLKHMILLRERQFATALTLCGYLVDGQRKSTGQRPYEAAGIRRFAGIPTDRSQSHA